MQTEVVHRREGDNMRERQLPSLPYHIGTVRNDSNGHPWKSIGVYSGDTYLASLPEGTRVYSEQQLQEYASKAILEACQPGFPRESNWGSDWEDDGV